MALQKPLNRRVDEPINYDMKESAFLYEMGRVFSAKSDLKDMLNGVMNLIARELDITRGSINVYNTESRNLVIDVAYGYSKNEARRGTYKPGEGIVGTVFNSGKPLVVSLTESEPLFLNKTGAVKKGDKDAVFICVPIELFDTVIGTVSIDKKRDPESSFSRELAILTAAAIMIAHAVDERGKALACEMQLKEENRMLKGRLTEITNPGRLIGSSQIMKNLYEKIYQVAPTNSTVLITGESGTGKEMIADSIFASSRRREGPFIKVNIASLPENLIESELFGHEKGAFTGAQVMKKGRFELANGGTIFLDEIGDLTLQSQVKLLRVLQEKSIERIGSTQVIPLDVRIIAATHQNLEEKVESGEFRLDLFYRLNVFPLYAPPLRERKADIMLLADFFLEKYSREFDRRITRISTEAINLLVDYHWPGNVRELENCIERAVILNREDVIRSNHLPPSLQMAEKNESQNLTLEEMTNLYVKEIITDSLKITHGNITKAAELLGTTKRILNYKIKSLGINYVDFRLR